MVYFAYRTTLVDGELDNITLHANPANMDGDVRLSKSRKLLKGSQRCEEERCHFCRYYRGENMRMIETPLSSYSVRYDSHGCGLSCSLYLQIRTSKIPSGLPF